MNTLCRCALVAVLVLLAACGRKAVREPAFTPAQAATANEVLFRALSLVGTPYRYGGNTPQTGFDCSGLIGYVFSDVAGVKLPRSAEAISELDAPSVGRNRLTAGDLVFFREGRHVSHVGIYVGEGRFVHAPNSGGTVRLDALDGAYWREHYHGAKRLFD
ncbi:MAG TPA: C40 family peptidase [Tahibacter sp.]|nr:C40 family peptidase [Tahibacter sp.]